MAFGSWERSDSFGGADLWNAGEGSGLLQTAEAARGFMSQ